MAYSSSPPPKATVVTPHFATAPQFFFSLLFHPNTETKVSKSFKMSRNITYNTHHSNFDANRQKTDPVPTGNDVAKM